MTDDQTARLIYLGLLGAVIGGYFLVQNRKQMGKMAQYAAIWGFIFVGAVVVIGLWEDLRNTTTTRQSVATEEGSTIVEVPRNQDGHYYLMLTINDEKVRFVVDTGATDLVLTQADAKRVGLDPNDLQFFGRAMTANGEVRTAQVTLGTVVLGGVEERGVRAVVNEGQMRESLLGMSYLQHFGRIEIADNRLRLIR